MKYMVLYGNKFTLKPQTWKILTITFRKVVEELLERYKVTDLCHRRKEFRKDIKKVASLCEPEKAEKTGFKVDSRKKGNILLSIDEFSGISKKMKTVTNLPNWYLCSH